MVNGLTVASIFPAKKKSEEQETVVSNGCDILIATPDRLREFLDQSKVDVSEVKHVVLDEVDRMLDATEDLKKVLKQVFSSGKIETIRAKSIFSHGVASLTDTKGQLIVFSESFPDSVRKLTKKYLADDHATITLSQDNNGEEAAEMKMKTRTKTKTTCVCFSLVFDFYDHRLFFVIRKKKKMAMVRQRKFWQRVVIDEKRSERQLSD